MDVAGETVVDIELGGKTSMLATAETSADLDKFSSIFIRHVEKYLSDISYEAGNAFFSPPFFSQINH